jgi:HD-like signal output (HDOD) protein
MAIGKPPTRATSPATSAKNPLGGNKPGSGSPAGGQTNEEGIQTPIEETVLASLGKENFGESPIFDGFIEKIAPRIRLPITSQAILESFSNIDVTAEKLAAVVKSNPYFEYTFLSVIQSISKRPDLPSLEAAVVLLGMQNSRNLILALQATRMVQKNHPAWSAEGKIQLVPQEVLKYALKTEEMLSKDKDGYADTAYAAGFVFDLMTMVIASSETDAKAATAYLDAVYAQGLRTAKIAMELGKFMPNFAYKKYIFAASLLHDIGKTAMTALDVSYLKFADDCSKKSYPRAMRYYAENQKFKTNHAVIGSLILKEVGVFKTIEKPVLYHHEPYAIQSSNKKAYQLAALVSLATTMSYSMKKPSGPDDPVIATWKGVDLLGFPLAPKDIAAAAQRVNL